MDVSADQSYFYEIRVQGPLAERWSDWFGGLTVRRGPDGETVLSGPIVDQAALHGILARVRDLNLILISVTRRSPSTPPSSGGQSVE